jgi:hypothetical protein
MCEIQGSIHLDGSTALHNLLNVLYFIGIELYIRIPFINFPPKVVLYSKKTNFVAVNSIAFLILETMMSFLKKYRKRKETEKERKELQELEGETKWNIEDYQKLSIILTLLLAVFSLVALIFSGIAAYNANQTTKLVTSTDYKISENLKYDLLEMVAVLKSIDNKAMQYVITDEKIDFSNEIESLNSIQMSPGYIVFLSLSTKDEKDRLRVESGIRALSDYFLVSKCMTMSEIRWQVRVVLEVLAKNANLDNGRMTMQFSDWLEYVCNNEMEYTISETSYNRELNTRNKDFVEYLKRYHEDDCDVLYYYYTFIEADSIMANKTYSDSFHDEVSILRREASSINPNVIKNEPYKAEVFLFEFLKEKYMVEYSEFCKKR